MRGSGWGGWKKRKLTHERVAQRVLEKEGWPKFLVSAVSRGGGGGDGRDSHIH